MKPVYFPCVAVFQHEFRVANRVVDRPRINIGSQENPEEVDHLFTGWPNYRKPIKIREHLVVHRIDFQPIIQQPIHHVRVDWRVRLSRVAVSARGYKIIEVVRPAERNWLNVVNLDHRVRRTVTAVAALETVSLENSETLALTERPSFHLAHSMIRARHFILRRAIMPSAKPSKPSTLIPTHVQNS